MHCLVISYRLKTRSTDLVFFLCKNKIYPQGTRPTIPKGPAAVPKKTVNKEKKG